MKITDLEAVGNIAKKHNILFGVDSTFATPVFLRPLEFGADLVMHSTTKYLSGHNQLIGGVVITNREDLFDQLKFVQKSIGAVPGPFDCWLTMRGLKTLAVRMREHERNATRLAQWLEEHDQVERVIYPGLPSHPHHELAKKQMSGFGGMVSFIVKGGLEQARSVLEGTKVFLLAESLGGVESLIEHPAIMTHASIPKERREEIGISDGLIRLSVGIEAFEDLQKDLDAALSSRVTCGC